MDQASIPPPSIVQEGTRYPYLYAIYLHTTAFLLRNLVSYYQGPHDGFDKDLVVETPGLGEGKVKISVCIPTSTTLKSKAGQQRPMVLVLEGGGFVLGQPKDGKRHDRLIADETGAIVISVDYAKSPRYEYPHALLQSYEVLKWSLSPAAENEGLFIDPSRVAVLGNSAGGNLSAALSLLVSFTDGPCAKFREGLNEPDFCQVLQVLLYPSVRLNVPYSARLEQAEGKDDEESVRARSLPVWAATMMEASYLPPYIDKAQMFVAPVVTEVALLKQLSLPRALIITAGLDCLKYEAWEYAEKLEEAGVKSTMRNYPMAIHGFTHYKEGNKGYRKEDVEDSWGQVCAALKDVFRESA